MINRMKMSLKNENENNNDSETDELTSVIGVFGPFQFTYTVLVGLSAVVMAFSGLGTKFLTYEVDFWCSRPDYFSNLSVAEWRNLSSPYLSGVSPPTFDNCHIFDVNYTNIKERPNEQTKTKVCKEWEFAQEPFQNTVMQRWSLVCDNDSFNFKTLSQSLFFAGATVGAFLIGPLADWYGRIKAFVISMFFYIVFGLISCFVDNPYVWITTRFFMGASFISNSTVKTVYQGELTSGSWRAKSHHWVGELFWQMGYLLTGLAVYIITDMKMFELFIALSGIPFLFFWFFVPESPRWLLGKGKVDEATAIMTKACIMNKKTLQNLEKLNNSSKEFVIPPRGYVTDMLKLPATRRNLICMLTCWFSCSMGYYGLIYNTPSFDWNLYLVFIFPALLAIPLVITQPFFVNKIGRKIYLTSTLALSGILLLLTLSVPDGKYSYNWPVIVCCWLGTTSSQSAFGAGYVFTKDLFPTTHRTTALSTVSAFARLGSLVSPFVALAESIDPTLTLVIYGSCLIVSAVISCFIYPDTTKTKMPETLEESERMAKTKFPCLSWIR